MRSLVLALVLGLAAPLSAHAQSVTLDVCDTGAIDIDVFVSRGGDVSGSHITPSTCAAVAKREGGIEQAYVGIAFTDSRGEWGAARRCAKPRRTKFTRPTRATRPNRMQRTRSVPRAWGRVLPEAMKEGQKAEQCARQIMKANPAIRTDPFWAGVTACMQGGN